MVRPAPAVARRASGVVSLAALEELVRSAGELRLTELARRLGTDPGQTHRAINGLVDAGYAEQDPDSHRYRPTAKVITLASALLAAMDIVSLARPHMLALRDRTGETVHLAQRVADGAVCVARELSEHPVAVTTAIGERFDGASAVGRAIALVRLESGSVDHGRAAFITDDGVSRPGVRCASAPVIDWQGQAIAAIAVSGPVERISNDRLHHLGAEVAVAARSLSAALGAAG